MSTVSVGDIAIAFDNHGQGQPLLFLHGAMVSRSYWQPQVDYFAPQYRVITCDLRGHGDSSVTDDPYSVALFARDIIGLLDTLGLEQVICCGHSLGGMVAQELSISHPERIRGLILADTWYYPRGMFWEPFPFRTVAIKWMLATMSIDRIASMMAQGLGMLNPEVQRYMHQEVSRHAPNRTNYLKIWDAAIDFDSASRLRQIGCPTLILMSAHFLYTYMQALEMRRRIKGAEVVMIPRSGHLLNLDNPEAFNLAVAQFLEQFEQTAYLEPPHRANTFSVPQRSTVNG